jgi:hypothetical protein
MCRQAPSVSSIGIHQVAVAQKSSVRPFRNGRSSASSGESGAAPTRRLPARVEIATAPMLIQYGGARSDGARGKNV